MKPIQICEAAYFLAAFAALPAQADCSAQRGVMISSTELARAYFAAGYARGQEDVLTGATVMGVADQYKLPPITDKEREEWRQASKRARLARDLHEWRLSESMDTCTQKETGR